MYQGSENLWKPMISQKMKIIIWECLITQMKSQDALIATQKTSTLCNVPLLKKSRRNPKNGNIDKNDNLKNFS